MTPYGLSLEASFAKMKKNKQWKRYDKFKHIMLTTCSWPEMKFSCISKILISHFLSILYRIHCHLLFVYTKQGIYMYNLVLFLSRNIICTNVDGKMSISIFLPVYWHIYPLYQMLLAQSSVIHFESEGRSTFTQPVCPVPLDCVES